MANVFTSYDRLIGRTPLLELTKLEAEFGLRARLLAKLECFNPTGSAKDRAAKAILDAGEADGRLKEGSVIIEPTSGNAGIALAALAAVRGYRAIFVMPDTMSAERRRLMRAYGAELVLSDGTAGMRGAVERARELADAIPNSFMPGQFDNPANPRAHRDTTGPEIWEDTDGAVDVFVSGVGSGGTITGAGGYLKGRNPSVRVVAVEPAGSPVLSGGCTGTHGIQGIGAGFVPPVLDTGIYDEICRVSDEEALAAARLMSRKEGVLVGISSGAALHAAIGVAKRPGYEGKTVVVILPDTGERYLSGALGEEI